jgi:uncharacterized protein Yka (UPF0111/DUF47 family)
MSEKTPNFLQRIAARVFPKTPDFFALLDEQAGGVVRACELLVEFTETGSAEIAARIREEEHRADDVKVRNLQILGEAFSTPIDREDIYRAIIGLDEVVNYCKATVNEMDVLGVVPGKHELDMAMHLRDGARALKVGYGKLLKHPSAAAEDCWTARKTERSVEKIYRRALAELFQGTDFINMFKRREIYRHISNAADRIAHCADTLQDIVVKMA